MRRRALSTALLVALAFSAGCGPRFQPSHDPNFNCLDQFQSVPIIVVARIENNAISEVGKPFRDDLGPLDRIQLSRASMWVENVLKGSVSLGDNDLFYFSPAKPYVGNKLMGFGSTLTSRHLLFLRRERGALRVFEDVTPNCDAEVYSGSHAKLERRPSELLRKQLVDLLLTPGTGATDMGMVRAIFDWAPSQLSVEYTEQALLRLASAASPVIRTAACLEFRDLLGGYHRGNPRKASSLAQELHIGQSQPERWGKLYEQNGPARDWWAHGPLSAAPPFISRSADSLAGLDLCLSDKALGVTPLTKPHQ